MEELPADIKHLYLTWLDESAAKFQQRQVKTSMIMSNASRALRQHTSPVRYPEELVKIKGIGPWVVTQMRKRLELYCKEEGWNLPPPPEPKNKKRKSGAPDDQDNDNDDTNTGGAKRKAPAKKAYVPRKRSGGYAILLVLLEFDPDMRGMARDSIIQNATIYCDSSFSSNPSTNNLYSAWSSVKILIKQSMVVETGRPARYYLTDEGLDLAKKIKENDNIVFRDEVNASSSSGNGRPVSGAGSMGSSDSQSEYRSLEVRIPRDRTEEEYKGVKYFYWEPGTFDVKFVVDNREMRSSKERDFFATKLQQLGIDADKKPLTVGDGLWIARHRQTNEEVVLDFILERKRLDDLSSSIKDNRYIEQKSRLKRTGITNVYYLIEEVTASDISAMSEGMQTSMSQALTTSGFHLQRTKDADGTVQFIARLTKEITKHYAKKRILVLNPQNMTTQHDYKTILDTFRSKFQNTSSKLECCHQYFTFDAMLSKTAMMTARELFIRMLMTVRGVTLEKAIAIQREFKTPMIMFEEFDARDTALQQKYGKKVIETLGEIFA